MGWWASDRLTPAGKSFYRWRHFALPSMSLIFLRHHAQSVCPLTSSYSFAYIYSLGVILLFCWCYAMADTCYLLVILYSVLFRSLFRYFSQHVIKKSSLKNLLNQDIYTVQDIYILFWAFPSCLLLMVYCSPCRENILEVTHTIFAFVLFRTSYVSV